MLTEPSSQTTTTASSSAQNSSGVSNSTESVTPTSSLASMIKVGCSQRVLDVRAERARQKRNWVESFSKLMLSFPSPSLSPPPPPVVSSAFAFGTDSNHTQVSPLKSLLREDLKRRITARANSRVARGGMNGGYGSSMTSSSSNNSGICNSSNTMIVSPEPVTPTTSNGTITSTGADNDTIVFGSSSKKRNLTCSYCGIEFPDQTLYFLHKGCHSESNPWKCNICSETCSNVYEFNSHLLSKSHQ
jgi:hypothetical protein